MKISLYIMTDRLFWPNTQCHLQDLNKLFLHLIHALCFCIIMISYFIFFIHITNVWSHDFSRTIWNKQALVNFFKDHSKFTRVYLLQIVLEIMWLPILIFVAQFRVTPYFLHSPSSVNQVPPRLNQIYKPSTDGCMF